MIKSFEPSVSYEVDDLVETHVARSWLDIWFERLTSWRWTVPLKEARYFRVTEISAGAMWPEVTMK